MKRKGHRDIPDFSKKATAKPHAPGPLTKKVAAPPPPAQSVNVKPQATSAKSGQRGR